MRQARLLARVRLRSSLAATALLGAALASGCSDDTPAVQRGAALFADPRLGARGASFQPYSCAFCHDVDPDAAGTVKAGFPLRDAATRPSFWGGERPTLRDATNVCVDIFMRARELQPDERDWRDLETFLVSVSSFPAPSPALPLTRPVTCNFCPSPGCDVCAPAPGGAAPGAEVYARACQSCHGAVADAAAPPVPFAPALRRFADGRLQVGDAAAGDPANGPSHVTGKIRFGALGMFGLPVAAGAVGVPSPTPDMPPFVAERLSATELADSIAYLFPTVAP